MSEEIVIRHAEVQDADDILAFIKENWIIENHVFTRRRDVFDNCHLIEDRLTFILAVGAETGKIYGFISYALNNHDFDHPDISAPMFQTLKTSNQSLGIDMVLALQKLTNCRALCSPGIVKKTKGLYDFLGYQTGLMQHYYRLGNVDEFKICHIEHVPELAQALPVQYTMRQLHTMDEIQDAFAFEDYRDVVPYRDAWSVQRRYFENIGYEYAIQGIFDEGGTCRALLVGRTIECNGAKMFKIIDYLGDDEALAHCQDALGAFIADGGYEYVDFYEFGIDADIMEQAGFTLREKKDTNIIPNYFEPFEQRNVDIYCYTTYPGKFHIYRTDSGQDRPNFIDEIGEASC